MKELSVEANWWARSQLYGVLLPSRRDASAVLRWPAFDAAGAPPAAVARPRVNSSLSRAVAAAQGPARRRWHCHRCRAVWGLQVRPVAAAGQGAAAEGAAGAGARAAHGPHSLHAMQRSTAAGAQTGGDHTRAAGGANWRAAMPHAAGERAAAPCSAALRPSQPLATPRPLSACCALAFWLFSPGPARCLCWR
jgi:hypothetical protein